MGQPSTRQRDQTGDYVNLLTLCTCMGSVMSVKDVALYVTSLTPSPLHVHVSVEGTGSDVGVMMLCVIIHIHLCIRAIFKFSNNGCTQWLG